MAFIELPQEAVERLRAEYGTDLEFRRAESLEDITDLIEAHYPGHRVEHFCSLFGVEAAWFLYDKNNNNIGAIRKEGPFFDATFQPPQRGV